MDEACYDHYSNVVLIITVIDRSQVCFYRSNKSPTDICMQTSSRFTHLLAMPISAQYSLLLHSGICQPTFDRAAVSALIGMLVEIGRQDGGYVEVD